MGVALDLTSQRLAARDHSEIHPQSKKSSSERERLDPTAFSSRGPRSLTQIRCPHRADVLSEGRSGRDQMVHPQEHARTTAQLRQAPNPPPDHESGSGRILPKKDPFGWGL